MKAAVGRRQAHFQAALGKNLLFFSVHGSHCGKILKIK